MIAIVTFSIMFVLSLSLTFSSSKILESQKAGRHYSYDISYDNYRKEEAESASDSVTYLRYDVDLMIKGETIAYQALSLTSQNDLFQLIGSKGEILDPTQGVFVNPEFLSDVLILQSLSSYSLFLGRKRAIFSIPYRI